jgi:hypothetical protein
MVALSATHPALMLIAGAVLGVGVATGVTGLQAPARPAPSAQLAPHPRQSRAPKGEDVQLEPKPVVPAPETPADVHSPLETAPPVAEGIPAKPKVARAVVAQPRVTREEIESRPESSAPRAASLAEQQVLLDAARRALARSDGATALEALTWHRARFPETVLGEERAALTVKALRMSGRGVEAQQSANEFLRRYPASVFSEGVVQPSKNP